MRGLILRQVAMVVCATLCVVVGGLLAASNGPLRADISSVPANVGVASFPAFNIDTGALVTLSAAGAGTTNSSDQTNKWGRSAKCAVDVTIAGGTPTLVVTVQGKDTASGKYYTVLASAALATVATTLLSIGPGLTASANVIVNDSLPTTWRLSALVGGVTPAVTATVGCAVTQ